MNNPLTYTLQVSGKLACFTRPELKVERVSYDVITPSAARAIFEAIYWSPQIRWRVVRIEILRPIAFTHIRRCEVASMASTKKPHIIAEKNRQLRSSLLLRDVSYRITAEMEPTLSHSSIAHESGTSAKHRAIFERRASRGQCFTQPYLGCREFSADWQLIVDEPIAPISESRDLGMMFYDMDFSDIENPQPKFFNAIIINGVIEIPQL